MQKYFNNLINRDGNAINNGSVQVNQYPSGTAAVIYSDNGVTTKSNPISTDVNGYFAFYAADGRYSLVVSGTGIETQTISDILLEDQADGSAALSAAGGSSLVGFTDAQGAVGTVAGLATKQVMRNNKTTATIAGEVPGLKIGICAGTEAGWLLNPAAGDFVAVYPYVVSSAARNRIWAMNPIIDIPSGFPATAWCYEGNINVGTADTPDPRNANHALGADMVSGGTFAPSAAFATYSSTLANRWKHGLWFDNIGGQIGSTIIKTNVNVSVDFGIDFSTATINYQGLRIGNTPAAQVAAAGFRQLANNQVGIFLQRFTDTSPTGNVFQYVNAANSVVLAYIDASGAIGVSNINAIGASLGIVGSVDITGNMTTTGISQGLAYRATAGAPTAAAGQVSYGATIATTVGAAGGAAALPATPLGYIIINVAGTSAKLPYYNT